MKKTRSRSIRAFVAVTLITVVGACVPPPTPTPTDVWVGDWSGAVTQIPGAGFPFDVSTHITSVTDPSGVAGTDTYTVFGCTGQLTVVSATAQTLQVHEHITVQGSPICTVDGDITMTSTGTGLADWSYTGGGYTATAHLARA